MQLDRPAEVRGCVLEDLEERFGRRLIVEGDDRPGHQASVFSLVVEDLVRDGSLELEPFGDLFRVCGEGVGFSFATPARGHDVDPLAVLHHARGGGECTASAEHGVSDVVEVVGLDGVRERVAGLEDLPGLLLDLAGGLDLGDLLRGRCRRLLAPELDGGGERAPATGAEVLLGLLDELDQLRTGEAGVLRERCVFPGGDLHDLVHGPAVVPEVEREVSEVLGRLGLVDEDEGPAVDGAGEVGRRCLCYLGGLLLRHQFRRVVPLVADLRAGARDRGREVVGPLRLLRRAEVPEDLGDRHVIEVPPDEPVNEPLVRGGAVGLDGASERLVYLRGPLPDDRELEPVEVAEGLGAARGRARRRGPGPLLGPAEGEPGGELRGVKGADRGVAVHGVEAGRVGRLSLLPFPGRVVVGVHVGARQ